MKKLQSTLLLLCLLATLGYCGEKNRFLQMTNLEIDFLLTQTAAKNMTITERISFYSRYFLETPWTFTCVGDGPYALLEPYPLVNFKETNCMALCEHVLALSISDSWDNFFNNLQQIRYRDGIIGMRTRNHYTMVDWLPENHWLLQDVTRQVGGTMTKSATRTISHKNFFAGKGITDMRYVLPDRNATVDYIPSATLKNIKTNLHSGDIGSLIFANKTDIFSAHMFIFLIENGNLVVRESSNSKMTTFDTPYEDWASKITASPRYLGIAVMRVRDELNRPGKIILPWQIPQLKKEVGQRQ